MSLSHVRLFATLWTVAYEASLSMGFCRQQYWSGLPFPSPAGLPDPRIKAGSLALQTDALLSEPDTLYALLLLLLFLEILTHCLHTTKKPINRITSLSMQTIFTRPYLSVFLQIKLPWGKVMKCNLLIQGCYRSQM